MYARTGLVIVSLVLGALAGCASSHDDGAKDESAIAQGDRIPSGPGVHVLVSGPSRAVKDRDVLSMASGEGTVWIAAPGVIRRATPNLLAIVDDSSSYVPELVAADKSGLYWLDSKQGSLMRADVDGQNIAAVDSWYWDPTIEKQLLLDSGKLLWRSQSRFSSDNKLWETPTPNGSATEKKIACADAMRDGVVYCWKGRNHVDAIDAAGKLTPLSTDAAPVTAFAAAEGGAVVYASQVARSESAPAVVELHDVTKGADRIVVRGSGATWDEGIRAVAVFGNTVWFSHANEIYSAPRASGATPKKVTKIDGAGEGSVLAVDGLLANGTSLFAHVVVRSVNADLPGATARETVVMIDLAEASTPPTTDAGDAGDGGAGSLDAGDAGDSGSIFDPPAPDAGVDAGAKDAGRDAPPVVTAPPSSSHETEPPPSSSENTTPGLPKPAPSKDSGCSAAPGDAGAAGRGAAFLAFAALVGFLQRRRSLKGG